MFHRSAVSRRSFVKFVGAGASGSGLLPLLQARPAPAWIRGTTLRILTARHVVPSYDAWFDAWAANWAHAHGVEVAVERVPPLALPARHAADASVGEGPDLICFAGQLLTGQYAGRLLDLSDLAEAVARRHGGWIPSASGAGQVGGRWYALPDFYVASTVLWRRDLFAGAGLGAPRTWDDLRRAAHHLRSRGAPGGIPLSHCQGANAGWRAVMYSFGAGETDPTGHHVALDSAEMREALRFARALVDEGTTPDVFSWNDDSAPRVLAAGEACWTRGASPALPTVEAAGPRIAGAISVLEAAAGPGGRVARVGEPTAWAIWRFSRNPSAARDFLGDLLDRQPEAVAASHGAIVPFLRGGGTSTGAATDASTAFFGHPGPMTPAAQEVLSTFVIPDVFIRVAQGAAIEDALRWGLGEMRRIHAKHAR